MSGAVGFGVEGHPKTILNTCLSSSLHEACCCPSRMTLSRGLFTLSSLGLSICFRDIDSSHQYTSRSVFRVTSVKTDGLWRLRRRPTESLVKYHLTSHHTRSVFPVMYVHFHTKGAVLHLPLACTLSPTPQLTELRNIYNANILHEGVWSTRV
jgi:hypothetical protein